jgi:hypothetical protein
MQKNEMYARVEVAKIVGQLIVSRNASDPKKVTADSFNRMHAAIMARSILPSELDDCDCHGAKETTSSARAQPQQFVPVPLRWNKVLRETVNDPVVFELRVYDRVAARVEVINETSAVLTMNLPGNTAKRDFGPSMQKAQVAAEQTVVEWALTNPDPFTELAKAGARGESHNGT